MGKIGLKKSEIAEIAIGIILVTSMITGELTHHTGFSSLFGIILMVALMVLLLVRIKDNTFWQTMPIMSVFSVVCKVFAYIIIVFNTLNMAGSSELALVSSLMNIAFIITSLIMKQSKEALVIFIYHSVSGFFIAI